MMSYATAIKKSSQYKCSYAWHALSLVSATLGQLAQVTLRYTMRDGYDDSHRSGTAGCGLSLKTYSSWQVRMSAMPHTQRSLKDRSL